MKQTPLPAANPAAIIPATIIIGVDEAGRGPLAGPVVASAVAFSAVQTLPGGIQDSKRLSAQSRQKAQNWILDHNLASAIVAVSAVQIDAINILQATMQAMATAIEQVLDQLGVLPHVPHGHIANINILIDGNQKPRLGIEIGEHIFLDTVVKGDAIHPQISAASILAKQHRDALMLELDKEYPKYGFGQHKGYPTAQHLQALRTYGSCQHHRQSFAPVRAVSTQSRVQEGEQDRLGF